MSEREREEDKEIKEIQTTEKGKLTSTHPDGIRKERVIFP
jgi:hypothetical protein